MNAPARPPVHTLVEVSGVDGRRFASRVEDVSAERISIGAPVLDGAEVPDAAGPPQIGDALTVRWAAGQRGRYALATTVVATHRDPVPVWVVQAAGDPQVEQHRNFVRGGGGEPVQLRRNAVASPGTVHGHVVDVGERSVRARFTGLDITVGEQVWVQLSLGGTVIPVIAEVLQVHADPHRPAVELVAVYEPGENQARAIRQYVLRQQLLARTRTAAG